MAPTDDVKATQSPVQVGFAVAGEEIAGVVGFKEERVSHVSCQILIALSKVKSRVVPPEQSLFSLLQLCGVSKKHSEREERPTPPSD
jgi:hypothetical protein